MYYKICVKLEKKLEEAGWRLSEETAINIFLYISMRYVCVKLLSLYVCTYNQPSIIKLLCKNASKFINRNKARYLHMIDVCDFSRIFASKYSVNISVPGLSLVPGDFDRIFVGEYSAKDTDICNGVKTCIVHM